MGNRSPGRAIFPAPLSPSTFQFFCSLFLSVTEEYNKFSFFSKARVIIKEGGIDISDSDDEDDSKYKKKCESSVHRLIFENVF